MPSNRTPPAQRLLQQGQVALTSGAWREARRAFEAALADTESAEAYEGLGAAAWWLDDGETVLQAREHAYQRYRQRADHAAAARMATELAEDCVLFGGEPAVARGWLKRAQRLLEGLPLQPEHGWLALIEGDLAISLDGDPVLALDRATVAEDIGRRLGLVDLEMLSLSLEGLALVSAGNVTEGMPRLDEAAVAAMSGEMSDLVAIGFTCCYLMTACERALDFERAAQWCRRVNTFCKRTQFSTLFSICRIQYASILLWRGEWAEAETELRAAVRNLAPTHPALQLDGIVRLAELRRHQGRTDEVESLLQQACDHPRATFERAALALDQEQFDTAAQLAQRFLRQTAAANQVERLPALHVLMCAELAAGHVEAAHQVLAEIQALAAGVSTPALRARARLAEGLVAAAAGDQANACRAFEDAIDLYTRSGSQFEKGRAHLGMASALLALGRTTEGRAEARTALDIFRRLGAGPAQQQAEALLRRPPGGRPPPLTHRELDVLRLMAQGLSNPRIAQQLAVSEFTAKRHVANILSKLDLPSRAAAAAYAARQGLA